MYRTLDVLVRLNARRFIVGASPELTFRTTDKVDTAYVVASYRQLASRDISFLPTSFKSPHSLRPMRARDTAYVESYATDVFITPCLPPCFVEGCQQGKNSVALINVVIKFGDEYFCFGIYFSKIFFVKTFFKFFFSKFFFKIFFSNFFSQTFFSKFSFQNFCFEGFTFDASPFTETKRTLCICVMKNMMSKRSKLDLSLV